MSFESSGGSGYSVSHEKSSCPSIGSVLDDYLIKNCGNFGNSCNLCSLNGNLEGEPCFEMIKAVLSDLDDKEEVVIDDDADVDGLPMDPFGMNKESNFTAFSDWFEDFEWGFRSEDGEFGVDENETRQKIGVDHDHDHLHFLGLSWAWNGAENFQPQNVGNENNDMSVSGDVFNGYKNFDGVFDEGVVVDGNAGGFLSVSRRGYEISSSEADESQNITKIECDAQGGAPHDALFFVLGYLGMQDLLSVEQVCKSLRDSVRGDPLLWRTVHVDKPLNERITDDALVKLTNRAQGTLQGLILVNCLWITDSGLGRVLQSNPRLMTLSVPDCIRLTIEGILFNLRALKKSGTAGIKHLRIGGLAGVCHVTDQQFEELKELLDASTYLPQGDQKPQFYRGGYSHIICEDGRAIDIEVCPRCQKLRPVYDCPAESCQQKHQAAQLCRGCTICIARCIHCGRCIKDFDYEETFCLDLLCLNCWNQFLDCPEEKEATKCTIISQRTMYQFCVYG
ncbi:F-box protein SKIP14-like [Abrus precatorius]|uniref:F-box protein SKIP14-like n=1 Tax=Abrus precatorius TaxID=3816 RepID=A0A8B8LPS0_ABRPR|nr:F-box protein SKIP14-like [Abrus precatorius]